MRIAILDHRVTPGIPIGSCHRKLLTGLSREHEFTVFAPEFDNPDPYRITHVRVPVPLRPQALLFCLYHLAAPIALLWHRITTGRRFDLVQGVECNSLVQSLAYTHFCHRVFLAKPGPGRGLSLRSWLRWLDHRLRAQMEPWVYRRAKQIVVPSEGLRRELAGCFPQVEGRVRVVRNPIRDDLGSPDPAFNRRAYRAGFGVQDADMVVLFASLGHFERKGLRLLIEALSMSTTQMPGTRITETRKVLAVVAGGSAAELAPYRTLARDMGVDSRVRFLGHQTDMRPHFQGADVFVLPSSYEACPLVALEAAAAGLPLITTHLNGVEDFARDGHNAILIERTAAALAAALATLFDMPNDVRLQMGRHASDAVQSYTDATFLDEWRETFRALIPAQGKCWKDIHSRTD